LFHRGAHHEKWDGSGYPKGLKNEESDRALDSFPLVDCLDALASDRSMARPSPDKPCDLVGESGKAYDPPCCEVLGRRYVELEEMARKTQTGGVKLPQTSSGTRSGAGRRVLRTRRQSSGRRPIDFLSRSGLREMRRRCVYIAQSWGNSLSLDETLSLFAT